MKKYLIASFILAATSTTLAASITTVTVNIKNVKTSTNVPFISLKYIYATPCPGQYCVNGGSNEANGIPSSKAELLPHIINPIMKNVFYPVPTWVAASETPPYYVWFGIYNRATQQSTFPASCEVLLNVNQNINTITIHRRGCTLS